MIQKACRWLSLALCGAAVSLAAGGVVDAAEPRQIGNLVTLGVPDIPEQQLDRVAPYLETRSARLLGLLADGGAVIRTRFGSTDQLHLVSKPLGARSQLTFYSEPITQAVVSPNRSAAQLVFLKDRGGDENYGIYLLDLGSGASRQLTQPGSRNGSPVWSADGQQLAFYSNRRNGRSWDIYLANVGRDQPATLLLEREPQDGAWWPLDFSPDGDRLVLLQYFSISDARLWILELGNNSLQAVALPPAGIDQASFARDGHGLWVTTDAFSEFRQLLRLDPIGGDHDSLSAHASWDVEHYAQSDSGEWLAYCLNEAGFSRLTVINLRQGVELALPDVPGARVEQMSFQPGSSVLGVTVSAPTAPADVYRLDLSREVLGFEQLTASEVGGLDTRGFSTAIGVSFPTFDSVDGKPRQLHALLYPRPGSGPHPVLIDIHGGPEGQAQPSFDASLQLFAQQLGFVIVRPNVRGSSGFGRSFLRLDNGRLRENSVRDIGALLDWIGTRPDLDVDRVALIGGSYGGYMVLASMAAYGPRLMGGIDRVGISNFVSFLSNTSGYRQALRRAEYGDEREPQMREFLENISPTRRAAQLTRPLLIFQGRNDPRVPASESRQMVDEITAGGGQVWYLEAGDEGHGIRRKANQRIYLAAVSYFLTGLLDGFAGSAAPAGSE